MTPQWGGHWGHLSLYSHVTVKPIKGSQVVTCGFLREKQRDRVKSGASRAVLAEKRWMAQLQSFGSKWRLYKGGGRRARLGLRGSYDFWVFMKRRHEVNCFVGLYKAMAETVL